MEFYRKIVDFSRIRSWIVGVEDEHAGHLTTTTAPVDNKKVKPKSLNSFSMICFMSHLQLQSGTCDFKVPFKFKISIWILKSDS